MKHAVKIYAWMSLLIMPFAVHSEITYDMGKTVYQDNCASCHGATGKGDGPLKVYLVKAPSDLTTITQRNHGTFPQQRLWEIIERDGNLTDESIKRALRDAWRDGVIAHRLQSPLRGCRAIDVWHFGGLHACQLSTRTLPVCHFLVDGTSGKKFFILDARCSMTR